MRTAKFFDKIRDCKISEIEIHNYVVKITSGFELERLEILAKGFDSYYNFLREVDEAQAINKLKQENKPIPYLEDGMIDIEKLFKPSSLWLKYLGCISFQDYLRKKNKEAEMKNKTDENLQNQLRQHIKSKHQSELIDKQTAFKEIHDKHYQSKITDFERDTAARTIPHTQQSMQSLIDEQQSKLSSDPPFDYNYFLKEYENKGHIPLEISDPNLPCKEYIDNVETHLPAEKRLQEARINMASALAENDFLEYLKKKQADFTSESNSGDSKLKLYQPQTFDELFVKPEFLTTCIEVLQKVEPAIIDGNLNYLLGSRQKGSIVAWIAVLKQRSKIAAIKDSDLAALLNDKFKGLFLGKDGRTLRNTRTTSYTKYHNQLLNLIT